MQSPPFTRVGRAKGFLVEFEQMVPMAVLRQGPRAFGLEVRREIEEKTGRKVSRGAFYAKSFYTTLDRMERKGYVSWEERDPEDPFRTAAVRLFSVTPTGLSVLRASHRAPKSMARGLEEKLEESRGAPAGPTRPPGRRLRQLRGRLDPSGPEQAAPGRGRGHAGHGPVSIRGGHQFSITFSPDGRELYFNRGPNIYEARWGDEGWTAPAPVSFNSDALDHEPHITSNRRRLFLGSARPREVEEGDPTYGIWVMERSGDGWGAPTFLFPGMYVTTTDGGDAYLTIEGGIGVYPWREGACQPVERVHGGVNTLSAVHPCIAPDGSFPVFGSDNDLCISVSDGEGSWSEPLALEELNTPGVEMTASLSPDGAYLFYYSHHDIYWVSTEVLQPYLSTLMGSS